jgi:hypothetical protein
MVPRSADDTLQQLDERIGFLKKSARCHWPWSYIIWLAAP